ncbi:capsid assembly scaffolding protein Gp46 family protein [Corynebacterium anserum]|uniref:Uncharacterized protein n=1 Tax=Corynebacterium anserum TaxID=2684406 RepID=A0A7G7YMJ0_9CORY|nr:DUF4355 domain-containing protein [Corynebacterium anserum]MBC2681079.1 DUF4355 domain-containing protein [Corynebacterium anserum]QNH95710.1 hypothetical protein GP473_02590 [Corynebacterium anserum]
MFTQSHWLRFIEGADGGAHNAPDQPKEPSQDADSTPADKQPDDEVDWKAKYEAMKTYSRQWEAKAKANVDAAKKLKEIEDAEKTEVDKLTERLKESEKDNQALQLQVDRMTIAAKFGISADDAEMFLHGDAETMATQAETLAQRSRTPRKAEAPNQGRGTAQGTKAAAEQWADSLLNK